VISKSRDQAVFAGVAPAEEDAALGVPADDLPIAEDAPPSPGNRADPMTEFSQPRHRRHRDTLL
jgi:hypothetical protein